MQTHVIQNLQTGIVGEVTSLFPHINILRLILTTAHLFQIEIFTPLHNVCTRFYNYNLSDQCAHPITEVIVIQIESFLQRLFIKEIVKLLESRVSHSKHQSCVLPANKSIGNFCTIPFDADNLVQKIAILIYPTEVIVNLNWMIG